MTVLSKATRLIEAITELPNAAMACVEMAREAVEYGRDSFGEVTALRKALADMSQMMATKERQVEAARAVSDDLEAKLATVEAELNREREARRWRTIDASDGVPGLTPVIFRQPTGSASRDFRTSLRMHLSEDRCPGCEWRYLSPEDMP